MGKRQWCDANCFSYNLYAFAFDPYKYKTSVYNRVRYHRWHFLIWMSNELLTLLLYLYNPADCSDDAVGMWCSIRWNGIFESGDPTKRAEAVVQELTHCNDPEVLARVSEDLGEAMVVSALYRFSMLANIISYDNEQCLYSSLILPYWLGRKYLMGLF